MVMACTATGCVHTSFTRTADIVVPARAPGCYLETAFERPPPHPFVVLGQVTTTSEAPIIFAFGENSFVAMRRVMEQACAVGAHGLMHVGTDTQLIRVGKGYWKRTWGNAVVFVYVDPSGRPLPPPGS
jgi:hypothetical protein